MTNIRFQVFRSIFYSSDDVLCSQADLNKAGFALERFELDASLVADYSKTFQN